MLTRDQRRAVLAYVDERIDTDTRRLIATATYDLHFGPAGAYEPDGDGWVYPGWEAAVERIRDAFDANAPHAIYLDVQSDAIQETEPEPWTDDDGTTWEPAYEDWIRLERRDIRVIYLGELADYL
jgi:hypothetical protein